MAYEDSKRLLVQAETFNRRAEAIRQAIELGMPLWEIEHYLDWLDQRRPVRPRASGPSDPKATT
jgi:hypothetical protein